MSNDTEEIKKTISVIFLNRIYYQKENILKF